MPPSSAAPIAAAAPSHVPHARPFRARARSDPCARGGGGSVRQRAAAEGPSCLFVGPIETASKEMLEALYQQARYSYYNGKPLIIDDMFDKVELKLRLYGSTSVVKYPRCSLKRQSTYADAEDDPSQVVALASVWILLLVFGSSAIIVPVLYVVGQAFNDPIHSRYFLPSGRSPFDMLMMLNAALFIGLGYLVGYPLASASALQGLWGNDLVALKGSCPNCGEEIEYFSHTVSSFCLQFVVCSKYERCLQVFAFVKAEKSNLHPQNTECRVCESALEFRPKVEQSVFKPGQRWVLVAFTLFHEQILRIRDRSEDLKM